MLHPVLTRLTEEEKRDYDELVTIIQNVTNIQHIWNSWDIMSDEDVKPFRERIRKLLTVQIEREDVDHVYNIKWERK